MNALEIVEQLKSGKSIDIRTSDAMEFMRQCQFHGLTRIVINMSFDGPRCTLNTTERRDTNARDRSC